MRVHGRNLSHLAKVDHILIHSDFFSPFLGRYQPDRCRSLAEIPNTMASGYSDRCHFYIMFLGCSFYFFRKIFRVHFLLITEFAGAESLIMQFFETLVNIAQVILDHTDRYLILGFHLGKHK